MNSVPALVLFDLGVTQYFLSTSFCRGFISARETLDRPLRVAIADDCMVSTSEIYRDCVLEIFVVGLPIDLIPIAMVDACVIVGMD